MFPIRTIIGRETHYVSTYRDTALRELSRARWLSAANGLTITRNVVRSVRQRCRPCNAIHCGHRSDRAANPAPRSYQLAALRRCRAARAASVTAPQTVSASATASAAGPWHTHSRPQLRRYARDAQTTRCIGVCSGRTPDRPTANWVGSTIRTSKHLRV